MGRSRAQPRLERGRLTERAVTRHGTAVSADELRDSVKARLRNVALFRFPAVPLREASVPIDDPKLLEQPQLVGGGQSHEPLVCFRVVSISLCFFFGSGHVIHLRRLAYGAGRK